MAEIRCQACGRSFMTADGPAMIEAIVGRCPDCDGEFVLIPN